jgi:outer membrane lipoprotein-sorting protein
MKNHSISKILCLLLLSIAFAFEARAQVSAQDLAAQLEKQLNSGAAVRMKFKANDESYSLLADLHKRRARIETGKLTIVTDGSSVWNYNKQTNQVTIDAPSNNKNSALQSPGDLFQFSSNYTSELVTSNGNSYTLKLTPNDHVRSMLNSLGAIKSLTLEVSKKGKTVTIKHASIETANGTNSTSSLSVKSVKTIAASDFIFTAPKGAKTVDLRE